MGQAYKEGRFSRLVMVYRFILSEKIYRQEEEEEEEGESPIQVVLG